MQKFTTLESHVVPLPFNDVDTDQIIPARFLKVTDKQGLGEHLFAGWRYLDNGHPKADFALNALSSQGAQILLAGENFGCGSSREHAPWALMGWGFRAVIARSFADIFRNNSLKNGLLPVDIDDANHQALLEQVRRDPTTVVKIDLDKQRAQCSNSIEWTFSVDDFAKHCLLAGTDQLGYLLSFEKQIRAYEARRT